VIAVSLSFIGCGTIGLPAAGIKHDLCQLVSLLESGALCWKVVRLPTLVSEGRQVMTGRGKDCRYLMTAKHCDLMEFAARVARIQCFPMSP
jgi:hypothetical protein